MLVVEDLYKDDVIDIIKRVGKTGQKGAFGDGKIFVTEVLEAYTVSSGDKKL